MERQDGPGMVASPLAHPLPKKPENPTLDELRPIVFLEVTRKCWTGLIIAAIMEQVEKNNILSEAQHGFRRKRSTHSQPSNTERIGNRMAAQKTDLWIVVGYLQGL